MKPDNPLKCAVRARGGCGQAMFQGARVRTQEVAACEWVTICETSASYMRRAMMRPSMRVGLVLHLCLLQCLDGCPLINHCTRSQLDKLSLSREEQFAYQYQVLSETYLGPKVSGRNYFALFPSQSIIWTTGGRKTPGERIKIVLALQPIPIRRFDLPTSGFPITSCVVRPLPALDRCGRLKVQR